MDHFAEFIKNVNQPLAILILQLILILLVTRVFGFLFLKISQPTVIGQIVAGIVLGPSLLGYFFPEYLDFLFSPESLKSLKLFSNLGLIFYMFMVGMELDINILQNRVKQASIISAAGMIVPFILGLLLSTFLYETYAPSSVTGMTFALFIGISMSITAFPVLARILQERNMEKTPVGSLVLTCAAVDDVTAWCLLAAITGLATASSEITAFFTIGCAILYALFMLKIVRPLIQKYSKAYFSDKRLHKTIVTMIFIVMLASSFITSLIGIHELFGAFMAGVIMPREFNFRENFIEKIEDVSIVLLLPVFFIFSGLRTKIGLINDWSEWLICLMVILVAVAGKFGGCFAASRVVGKNWKDSLSIGILMNTRGMMELIILNIGYELGILSSEIFTIFVLMALATTFLTNPCLNLIERYERKGS